MEILASRAPCLQDRLSTNIMKKIYNTGRYKTYSDREIIQRRGDTRLGISILKKGKIVAGNNGADGSFLISTLLQPGECFGEFTLFAQLPRTHDLTAVGNVEVLDISKAAFFKLMEDEPEISKALLFITLRRSHGLLEFMDSQKRLSLVARVAKLITRLIAQQVGQTNSKLVINCRQEELAFILGVTRVSISHALKRLNKLELITTGYGKIEIKDKDKLNIFIEQEMLIMPVAGLKFDATRIANIESISSNQTIT